MQFDALTQYMQRMQYMHVSRMHLSSDVHLAGLALTLVAEYNKELARAHGHDAVRSCEGYQFIKYIRYRVNQNQRLSLQGHRIAQGQSNRRALKLNPDNRGLAANILDADAGASDGAVGDRDGDGNRAGVAAAGANSDRDDALTILRVAVLSSRLAGIASHTINEILGKLVVGKRHNRPGGQTSELLGDSLEPALDQRELAGLTADGDGGRIHVGQVGLVEHVRIGLEVEEVLDVGGASVIKKILEGAAGALSENIPLAKKTVGGIAVVVDGCGISRDDPDASSTVRVDSRSKRPVDVLAVAKNRTGVVTNNILDAVVGPGADGVTVVKTGNGRRNNAVRSEVLGVGNAHLLQPGLVELNLTSSIVVCGVVELFVGEGVRNVGKRVEVGRVTEPVGKGIETAAVLGPSVRHKLRGPDIETSTKRLLELERRVGDLTILNSVVRNTDAFS